ncbi:uncharacterized protein BDR25DRAFT_360049 [Lindgomyces ingoldianus]|uniref:Uncharacterized protein n=1 Tax=Lindgomyces ingoldianus TaxID=673940 RepID=A0ACB6QG25_9PLEO|nr:uncharacterized protein BDR25DRAFT_360049 [Lindgomyces ingoldianus]KAF2465879.1 hypothetical protein BDR25DRAFT_360049 [Lindgomyces ingoldianus]
MLKGLLKSTLCYFKVWTVRRNASPASYSGSIDPAELHCLSYVEPSELFCVGLTQRVSDFRFFHLGTCSSGLDNECYVNPEGLDSASKENFALDSIFYPLLSATMTNLIAYVKYSTLYPIKWRTGDIYAWRFLSRVPSDKTVAVQTLPFDLIMKNFRTISDVLSAEYPLVIHKDHVAPILVTPNIALSMHISNQASQHHTPISVSVTVFSLAKIGTLGPELGPWNSASRSSY